MEDRRLYLDNLPFLLVLCQYCRSCFKLKFPVRQILIRPPGRPTSSVDDRPALALDLERMVL